MTVKNKSKYFKFFGDQQLIDLLTREELVSLKKLRKGHASEYDQQLAYRTIVNKICRLPCAAFHEAPTVQSFNEGVRHVGQLMTLVDLENIDNYKDHLKPTLNINK